LVGNKRILRQDILRKTEEYIARGGQIKKLRSGESAERADGPRRKAEFVGTDSSQQSDLKEVILEIDKRKTNFKKPPRVSSKSAPRKKIIYDDFGEPLREIWVEK
jgi:hypothetical protein